MSLYPPYPSAGGAAADWGVRACFDICSIISFFIASVISASVRPVFAITILSSDASGGRSGSSFRASSRILTSTS